MKRMALAAAGLVLVGGVSVAVPAVSGGSASASYVVCVDQSLLTSDHHKVEKQQKYVKTQQAKIKKLNHEKPKTAAAKKAKQRNLATAHRKLAHDQNQLRHARQVYSRDQSEGLCDAPTAPATSTATPTPTDTASPTTGSGLLGGVCSLLPVPGLC